MPRPQQSIRKLLRSLRFLDRRRGVAAQAGRMNTSAHTFGTACGKRISGRARHEQKHVTAPSSRCSSEMNVRVACCASG